MSTFETTATVDEQGRVLVADLPFAPGAEVAVTISPKARLADDMRRGESAPADVGETPSQAEDIFAEMRPFMVDVADVDDSREAIYTRLEGE
ncbi:MAG: hypothetical protein KY475_05280 [Planctomycetes bacterium]|nr:hypothetical protein [Planctomycetota bacterium]